MSDSGTKKTLSPYPKNLTSVPPEGISFQDEDMTRTIWLPFATMYRKTFPPLTDAEWLREASTGDIMNGAQDVSGMPTNARPLFNLYLTDQARKGALILQKGEAEGAKITAEESEQVESFWKGYEKLQSVFEELQADKAPNATGPTIRRLSNEDSLVDMLLQHSIGRKRALYSIYPVSGKIRDGSYSTLLEKAGLTQEGQSYYPWWDHTHARRRQIASAMSSQGPDSLNKDTYNAETIKTIIEAVSKLYQVSRRFLSSEDDAKVANTMQAADKALIEPTKWAIAPQIQAEQIMNMALVDAAYEYLQKKNDAGEEMSAAATAFIEKVSTKQKTVPGWEGSFMSTMLDAVESLVKDPFDGAAYMRASLCNEATSKWMNVGVKNLLYGSEGDATMDGVREHLSQKCSDIYTGKMDKMPQSVEERMTDDMAKQAKAIWSLLTESKGAAGDQ